MCLVTAATYYSRHNTSSQSIFYLYKEEKGYDNISLCVTWSTASDILQLVYVLPGLQHQIFGGTN